jgi:hypothetical protein
MRKNIYSLITIFWLAMDFLWAHDMVVFAVACGIVGIFCTLFLKDGDPEKLLTMLWLFSNVFWCMSDMCKDSPDVLEFVSTIKTIFFTASAILLLIYIFAKEKIYPRAIES